MSVQKAVIINTETLVETPVMFNPQEYTLDKTNTFKEQKIPGMPSPNLQYLGGGVRSLRMKLFFDTYEAKEDVRFFTKTITSLLALEDVKTKRFKAPLLIFSWGWFSLRCVLVSVTEQFTLFLQDGTPARAELTVHFRETWAKRPDTSSKEAKKATRKIYRVKHELTLEGIATITLGDHRRWREIAELNELELDFQSLRRVPSGTLLRIPKG